MILTDNELRIIADSMRRLLDMHISADFDVEELTERIENYLNERAKDTAE